jgi:hypothetical protein
MKYIRVTGVIEYEEGYHCDCEHCQGHGTGVMKKKKVDVTVETNDERKAPLMAARHFVPSDVRDWGEYEWVDGPHFSEPAMDWCMRKIGAPTLSPIGMWTL